MVVEWDRWACDTVRENASVGYPLVSGWSVHEGDVRGVDWADLAGTDIDLVAGGPPCQPFSMGGKHGAFLDPRDMFPATAEVIRGLRPRAFLIENVKGLTRTAFANYFAYIQLRLALPEIVPQADEKWSDHFQRLQNEFTSTSDSGLSYKVITTLVDAADYGVPQRRHRVFMIGFRSDVDAEWAFPEPTHSRGALLYDQWVSGEYWDRHRVASKDRPEAPVTAHKSWQAPDAGYQPWRTVRDALHGLPEPSRNGSRRYLNHLLQPGARSYPGHTGSPLDHPAKTLKSGVHGVPGGENMLRRPDGSVRYFSVREAARLQTFPDRYELHGAWSEAMRQLGNAVPVMLAEKVAGSVARHLELGGVRARQSGLAAKRASA
jgi:DNA (cytosine-5)-methyltransferase 1